jgi:hypothetical protein
MWFKYFIILIFEIAAKMIIVFMDKESILLCFMKAQIRNTTTLKLNPMCVLNMAALPKLLFHIPPRVHAHV